MTAMGGFVDVSELVFTAQAGARFLYARIWVIVLGTIIIIVFGEMSGRVAAISKQPVFNLMRQRLGLKFGLIVLVAASIVNLITCAAEIGGIGIVMHLGLGIPYRLATCLATIALIATCLFPKSRSREAVANSREGLSASETRAFRFEKADPTLLGWLLK